MENAARLRLLEFGLALDDYGQGHSTLDQLRRLPFSELKIDRAFVSGITSDSSKSHCLQHHHDEPRPQSQVETEGEAAMLRDFAAISHKGLRGFSWAAVQTPVMPDTGCLICLLDLILLEGQTHGSQGGSSLKA